MILRNYDSYAETNLYWLPKIPKDWDIVDIRRGIELLTDFEANGSFADVKSNVQLDTSDKYAWYVRATDLENNRLCISDEVRTCNKKAYDFLKKTKLYGGELLVAKRGEIGKVYVLPQLTCKATLAPNLYLIRFNKKLNSKYVYYWFLSTYGKPELLLANKSTTIGAIYKDDVRACKIPLPAIAEQKQIANFLDYEIAKIDTLIEKQQRLIELLTEKRQAVISHAVTKGLNPDVPMKDSGVEWLGEVPGHWEVGRLKNVLRIKNGRDYKAVEVETGGYPVYGSGGIFRRSSKYLFDGESVLFGRKGTIDKPLLVSGKFWTVDTMFYSEVFKNAKPEYIHHQATLFPFDMLSTNTALPSMTQEDLLELGFVIPPLSEQVDICQYLKAKLETFSELTSKAQQAIQLMQERRTALISAAVTGKIDVRDWDVHVASEVCS